MAGDWARVLGAAEDLPFVRPGSVGYLGLSIGTAYGLMFCAGTTRVKVAVFGLWSADYPNSASLVGFAREIKQPTLFVQKWDDEFMSRNGQFQLFDALSTSTKQLNVYPGRHAEPSGPLHSDACRFLASGLYN
jgi:cephalosporin-C deacetylase-like acetyl esterase